MLEITEYNIETGEAVTREMTKAEAKAHNDALTAAKEAREAAETKRAEAIAKLETLGLTADDIRAILG